MHLLIIFGLFFGSHDITYIRELYVKAATTESQNKLLLKTLNDKNSLDVTCEAYRGAATVLMAKHSINPYSKLKHFYDGQQILESAIKKDPENVEARYLRFTIQSNVPDFLGYNRELDADKKFLIRNLSSITDSSLLRSVCDYLLLKADLSASEKIIISKTNRTLAP